MILAKLDRPDPELDKMWAEEATKRWAAYKEGRLKAIPYDEAMARYRDQLGKDRIGMKNVTIIT
jgi:hypothetical protein